MVCHWSVNGKLALVYSRVGEIGRIISAGVSGVGAVVDRAGWLVDVLRWFGVAFLLWYAAGSLRRAFRPESLTSDGAIREPRRTVVGKAVALTWLNPHVYLDTVVLLGSMASTYDEHRWQFAAGAALGSALWFTGLGFGARLLRPVFARPAAWRVLDGAIAVVMSGLAISLALRGVLGT